ncbi:MAG: hypothetical protein ACRDSJ_25665 [Rubrobacteraceae bacterium]
MRFVKRDREARERGFASGCLGIFLEILTWVFSTVLITIGAAFFLFGVFSFEPEFTVGTVVAIITVPLAAFLFLRTGRAILRDLRGKTDAPPNDREE